MSFRRLALSLALAFALGSGCKAPPSREKTDVVHMDNGDRLTGEIKSLDQGKLRLKTSALDTVYVEWNKVKHVTSTYDFEFEDKSGARHDGHIVEDEEGRATIVADDGIPLALSLADIVQITPIDQGFWQRLDGSFSLGFNYTKGTDITQLVTDAEVEYRTRKARNELDFSSTLTEDAEGVSTTRTVLSMEALRYRDRWFTWGFGSLEKNESLGLDLRTLLAAGPGRSLISTSQDRLEAGLGVAVSREDSVGSSSSSEEVEGILWATYSVFHFGERDIDSDFEAQVYPGITESGSLRGELDVSIRREIAKNLFLELSGYYSYDNQPPSGGEESDFGINTSLGWSF